MKVEINHAISLTFLYEKGDNWFWHLKVSIKHGKAGSIDFLCIPSVNDERDEKQ